MFGGAFRLDRLARAGSSDAAGGLGRASSDAAGSLGAGSSDAAGRLGRASSDAAGGLGRASSDSTGALGSTSLEASGRAGASSALGAGAATSWPWFAGAFALGATQADCSGAAAPGTSAEGTTSCASEGAAKGVSLFSIFSGALGPLARPPSSAAVPTPMHKSSNKLIARTVFLFYCSFYCFP